MPYKLIGFVVVKGARWYLHRRFGGLASRRTAAASVVGLAIAGAVLARRLQHD